MSNPKEIEFLHWLLGLTAGRRARIEVVLPSRRDAPAALARWRTSREAGKHQAPKGQVEAEKAEIRWLEAVLRTK